MRFLKRAAIVLALLLAGGGGWLAYQLGHPAPPPAALQLPAATLAPDALRAQFFGATTLLLRDGRNAVMIDALLSRPAMRDVLLGKIGPDPARIADTLARGKVDRVDLLLVTHSHYDMIFLAVGGLGAQPDGFVERYWRETVGATGARLVIPTHWDDFLRPLDGPFEPLPRLMDDVPAAMAKMAALARRDGVTIRTMPPVAPVDVATAIPGR